MAVLPPIERHKGDSQQVGELLLSYSNCIPEASDLVRLHAQFISHDISPKHVAPCIKPPRMRDAQALSREADGTASLEVLTSSSNAYFVDRLMTTMYLDDSAGAQSRPSVSRHPRRSTRVDSTEDLVHPSLPGDADPKLVGT